MPVPTAELYRSGATMAIEAFRMEKDWLNTIVKLGVPGAIAVFLVWRLAGGFDVINTRLLAVENQHAAIAAQAEATKDLTGRVLMSNERVLWVLQVMCANDAKTPEARERCLRER